jgi:hypothetical protein
MKRNKFARLAMHLVVICAITFVMLESLLLICNDLAFPKSFYVFDPDMGFRVRPYALVGHDRTNEFGFNDRDYPHERRSDTFRVLFLSDSYNWMGGRYCNYTALLRRRLSDMLGSNRVEVIAGGYSQTHAGEQLQLLKKFGLQYNPDLVVLGFFAGNDFYDAHPNRKRIVYGGAVTDIYTNKSLYTTILGQPLTLRSRLLLFLRERWLERNHFQQSPALANTDVSVTKPVADSIPDCRSVDAEQPIPLEEDFLRMLGAIMEFSELNHASRFQPFEKYIFDSLLEMRDILSERHIGFLVAAYPSCFQIDPAVQRRILERLGKKASDYDFDRAQRILASFCQENGIEFHDLSPAFREAQAKGSRLYRTNDDHWSAAGNGLAASYMFDLLAERARTICCAK